jgi:hypothetical protein
MNTVTSNDAVLLWVMVQREVGDVEATHSGSVAAMASASDTSTGLTTILTLFLQQNTFCTVDAAPG